LQDRNRGGTVFFKIFQNKRELTYKDNPNGGRPWGDEGSYDLAGISKEGVEGGVKAGANASPSASPNKKWATA